MCSDGIKRKQGSNTAASDARDKASIEVQNSSPTE